MVDGVRDLPKVSQRALTPRSAHHLRCVRARSSALPAASASTHTLSLSLTHTATVVSFAAEPEPEAATAAEYRIRIASVVYRKRTLCIAWSGMCCALRKRQYSLAREWQHDTLHNPDASQRNDQTMHTHWRETVDQIACGRVHASFA